MRFGQYISKLMIALLLVAMGWRGVADDLEVAKAALRDGLWDLARTHAYKVDSDTAKLVVLESLANENKWDEIREQLTKYGDKVKLPAFEYYRAVVNGDEERAAKLLTETGSVVGVAEGKMLEADYKYRKGNLAAAEKLWRAVVAMSNVSERAFAVASINLGDEGLLRKALANSGNNLLRRRIAVRLGVCLLDDEKTIDEGEKIIRGVVADSPDSDGVKLAMLALAAAKIRLGWYDRALKDYVDIAEIWTDSALSAEYVRGHGDCQIGLGNLEEALKDFQRAEELSTDDESKAQAILRQGDTLSSMLRFDDAMAAYGRVLKEYPKTTVAGAVKRIVDIREKESKARALFSEYRIEEAEKLFKEVASLDRSRQDRMAYCLALCQYGMGRDTEAGDSMRELMKEPHSISVRSEAMLWLAKYCYNHGLWKKSGGYFESYAEMSPKSDEVRDAMILAAKCAFFDGDYKRAIGMAKKTVEKFPGDIAEVRALIVQGMALIEASRFDEAVLVLDRAMALPVCDSAMKFSAHRLKADAFFAMGADNSARYREALQAYRSLTYDNIVSPSDTIVIAFKVARTLEKLKLWEEAEDQYYAQVIHAYRDGCKRGVQFNDEACGCFSMAAFRLADEYEARGRSTQAVSVLRLVEQSDVTASAEASRRIERITSKGRIL